MPLFFRVPLILNQSARFNFGFASNMTLLLWCVFGGFLHHILGCNFLTMLIKPNFEKPIDSPEDVLKTGFPVIWLPGYGYFVENAKKQNHSEVIRKLAERAIVPKVKNTLISYAPLQLCSLCSAHMSRRCYGFHPLLYTHHHPH